MAPESRSARWWSAVQLLLLVTTLAFVGRALSRQWSDVREVAKQAQVAWGWVVLASVLVLLVHVALVQGWRMVLDGWGSPLRFGAAVRIWTVSGLGKYVPGKLWSIAAMGLLTQREGGSRVAAAGAALLGTLLNLGTGFGVVALSGSSVMRTLDASVRTLALFGAAVFVIVVLALPWLLPPVLERVARWRGLPPLNAHLTPLTIWLATLVNVFAWIGYGLAFMAFAHGVTPQIVGTPATFIAAYTASYIVGYLALYAPGGLGVREFILIGLVVSLGLAKVPEATFLALASRVWLTILEVLPGLVSLPFTPSSARVNDDGSSSG